MVVASSGLFRSAVGFTEEEFRMIPRTIARYGVRSLPGDEKVVVRAFRRGEAVSGPAIEEFEDEFAKFHGMKYATAASFGRMAFHYILQALNLPAESEIIFPAIEEFEDEFAKFHGMKYATAASFGRMAFHYILQALNLPAESEIIFPA